MLSRGSEQRPTLLWDVMSTLIYDPFMVELPGFFGMSFKQLIEDKDAHAWPAFERGELDEDEFWRRFFKDRRAVDAQGLRQTLKQAYAFEPGMEALLEELKAKGYQMHTMTNYPSWWRLIEDKLALSRYVQWSFISCQQGLRKPQAAAYERAAELAGVSPTQCLFIDDRESNCEAARGVGMEALRYEGASALRAQLGAMGLL